MTAREGLAIKPEALTALKNYTQADADGVMVNVSRQALDEAIAALSSLPSPELPAGGLCHDHPMKRCSPDDCCLPARAPHAEVREALAEAIAVFEGMCDDEIDVELLPRLRAALSPPSERETGK
jgi:hypothetical protein